MTTDNKTTRTTARLTEEQKFNTTNSRAQTLNTEQQEFLEHIKSIISNNKKNPKFDLTDLAEMFSVTPRTIQRKLKACGTTFITLKNEERVRYLAARLLQGNVNETLHKMAGLTSKRQKI